MQLLLFLWISHTLLGINEPNPSHKFYVSTTEIEFKEDSKSLQITSQLFIDDIELQLRSNQNDLKQESMNQINLEPNQLGGSLLPRP